MQQRLDHLARLLGRRLPHPLDWVSSLLCWVTFPLMVLSVWPDRYQQFETLLRDLGAPVDLPPAPAVIPFGLLVAGLQLGHNLAIQRRDRLFNTTRKDAGINAPFQSSTGPWILQKNRHMWIVSALGVGLLLWTSLTIDAKQRAIAAKCDPYEAAHKTRPDHFVDCPYD